MRIIAGTFRGRVLRTMEGPGYRPAMAKVRESLFSMLESRGVVWSECTALDLFAGSGSLAFESLSRGAVKATLVESYIKATRYLQQNAGMLGLDTARCNIVKDDVLKFLSKRQTQSYSLVFIDPPYGMNLLGPTLEKLLRNDWIHEDSIVTAEVESSAKFAPDEVHENLEVLTERTFGQTRVILWQVKKSV